MRKLKIFKYGSWLFFIFSPCVLMMVLSKIYGKNLFLTRPFWSDELGYWREVLSFSKYGFGMGYQTIDEVVARAGPFGTHGIFISFFYQPFAKFIKWEYSGIVISNIIFVVFCFLVFVFSCRPTAAQSLALATVYLTFIPIILYTATSMTEMINYGFLTLFLAFSYKYFNSDKNKNIFLILMLFIGIISCFYRIIYILLLLIFVLIYSDFKINKKFFISSFVWLIISGLIYYLNSLFTSPYPFGFLYNFTHSSDFYSALKLLFKNIIDNIIRLFSLGNGEKVEIIFRFFYLAVLILYFIFIFMNKTQEKRFLNVAICKKINFFYVFLFLLLILPLLVIIMFYDVYSFRDYRSLSPFLWISLACLIINKKYPIIKVIFPMFLGFFVLSLVYFPNNSFCANEQVRWESLGSGDFSKIQNYVKRDDSAKNGFDNTLSTDAFDSELFLKLDPGIGISYICKTDGFKSKYLLIHKDLKIDGYSKKCSTKFGILYIRN